MPDEKSRSSQFARTIGSGKCVSCGAPRAADQRYCLSCGTRIMPMPMVLANWLERIKPKSKAEPPAEGADSTAARGAGAAAAGAAAASKADEDGGLSNYMP